MTTLVSPSETLEKPINTPPNTEVATKPIQIEKKEPNPSPKATQLLEATMGTDSIMEALSEAEAFSKEDAISHLQQIANYKSTEDLPIPQSAKDALQREKDAAQVSIVEGQTEAESNKDIEKAREKTLQEINFQEFGKTADVEDAHLAMDAYAFQRGWQTGEEIFDAAKERNGGDEKKAEGYVRSLNQKQHEKDPDFNADPAESIPKVLSSGDFKELSNKITGLLNNEDLSPEAKQNLADFLTKGNEQMFKVDGNSDVSLQKALENATNTDSSNINLNDRALFTLLKREVNSLESKYNTTSNTVKQAETSTSPQSIKEDRDLNELDLAIEGSYDENNEEYTPSRMSVNPEKQELNTEEISNPEISAKNEPGNQQGAQKPLTETEAEVNTDSQTEQEEDTNSPEQRSEDSDEEPKTESEPEEEEQSEEKDSEEEETEQEKTNELLQAEVDLLKKQIELINKSNDNLENTVNNITAQMAALEKLLEELSKEDTTPIKKAGLDPWGALMEIIKRLFRASLPNLQPSQGTA